MSDASTVKRNPNKKTKWQHAQLPPPPAPPAPQLPVQIPAVTLRPVFSALTLEEALNKRKVVKKARELPTPIPSNYQELGCTKKLRIVVWSDTHNHHSKKDIPAGDVLLHCGDMTNAGRFGELDAFNKFYGTLPHKHKIVICGNHEKSLASKTPEEIQKIFTNATYLQDSSVTIEGIKIYGTPWVKNMSYHEPWMKKKFDNKYHYKSEEDLAKIWEQIPEDVDILMTHIPPFKILDASIHGSETLAQRLLQLKRLKIHCFGHVHPMYGYQETNGTMFINAALDDDEHPFVFDYYHH